MNRHEVLAEIDRLTVYERAISDRRNELHDQIDRMYLAAPVDPDQVAELHELEALEREVSTRRAELHRQIDYLRAKIGLPPWRESRGLDSVA